MKKEEEEEARMISLCSREKSATSSPCAHGCCPDQCLGAGACAGHEHERPNVTSAMASRENFARSTKSTVFPNTHFTNPESLPPLPDAFSAFLDAYPGYRDTRDADRIRDGEYPHLSRHVCLDYTGLSLFSHAQLHSNSADQSTPSSSSSSSSRRRLRPPFFSISYKPTSLASHVQQHGAPQDDAGGGGIESAMRSRIMRFLNVSEEEYSMACAANKTAAFRLLAEAYPFRTNRRLLTVYEHESEAADAMAEAAGRRGAKVASAGFTWPRLRIDSAGLERALTKKSKKRGNRGGLLVFPLQSSMTGTRHPYFWMRLAQENGWHVLLDACALGPKDTDTLGLSLIRPDFMVCSFFRLVGEDPSGFAALFVKRSSRAVLEAAGTSGHVGVVSLVPPPPARTASSQQRADDFSGTASECSTELECADVREVACEGLDHADALGLIAISCRLRCLTNWLVAALGKLRHPGGGRALVRVYGPGVRFDRGPAVAFNVFDWRGERVEPAVVQKLADRSSISLGCGFLRNICCFPEGEETERRKSGATARRAVAAPGRGGRSREGGDCGIGVVNASLWFMSNFEDAYRLWSFVANFLDADFVEKERRRTVSEAGHFFPLSILSLQIFLLLLLLQVTC
ncbi:putative molybdenum cofactor sulfurase 3 [Iris pallida]|uniref:Molybdenum cofactor sulfurase 3 n=1 Tax=Iris pallida TaxID=29817 RepID=A0AAX6HEZ2_IRIPA|nr:putative molybdenum cofactor sulfurase 3 [Iris pallida]